MRKAVFFEQETEPLLNVWGVLKNMDPSWDLFAASCPLAPLNGDTKTGPHFWQAVRVLRVRGTCDSP